MQVFYDLLPVVLFFIVYKFAGIYAATGAAIIISALQVIIYWVRYKQFEKMQLVTFVLILLLGGATLFFHNPIFIKWKPTAIYWAFSIIFIGSHFIGKKPLLQYVMAGKVDLPAPIWAKLNLSWAIFFAGIGLLNIYVAYHYSTNTWVNFKLFGIFGLMLVFIVIQAFYLSKHVKEES